MTTNIGVQSLPQPQKATSAFQRLSHEAHLNSTEQNQSDQAISAALEANLNMLDHSGRDVEYGIPLFTLTEDVLTSLQKATPRRNELSNQSSQTDLTEAQFEMLEAKSSELISDFNHVIEDVDFNSQNLANQNYTPATNEAEYQTFEELYLREYRSYASPHIDIDRDYATVAAANRGAAQPLINDVGAAEESAKLIKLQLLQNTRGSLFAQANQNAETVMSLLSIRV